MTYPDADTKTLTTCCGGLTHPDMPFLHAEDCPERKRLQGTGKPLFYREDPDERRYFDDNVEAFVKTGEPVVIAELRNVLTQLDSLGRLNPYHGSFARMCFVEANAVLRSQEHIKGLYALLRDVREHLKSEGIAGHLAAKIDATLADKSLTK